jgi:predicted transposase YbfD/YdcC
MLVVLSGCLAGADNFVEMAGWARMNLEALRQIRPFARGVPSHDTLNDVVNALDPGTFEECFLSWIEAIRPDAPDLIAIDGKTSRRTGNARTGQRPLHTLSAYAREQRLVLAQEVVDGKSNEGAMIPSLLDKLRLKGSLVTIDAAGSYRPIAERIVEAEADYLLTVKANQPKLLAGIKAALAQAAPDTVQRCESVETSHGRQEHRRCTVAPAPAGLGGKTPWAGLKYVAAVEGTFVRSGKLTTLTRYYITSRALTADQLLEAVRGHWSIENSVHWVLDVVFGDDYQRLRSEYGPRNMALVQRIALNLIRRRPSGKDSLTVKRKKAGWSTAYLIETIAAVPA